MILVVLDEETLDALEEPVVLVDEDFVLRGYSSPAAALLDEPEGTIVGRALWDVLEDRVTAQLPDVLHEATEAEDVVRFDVALPDASRWYEGTGVPLSDGLALLFLEVSDRERRAERLAQRAAVLDAVQELVLTIDDDHHIASVNRAVLETFDVDREALVGEHVEAFVDVAGVDDEGAVEFGGAIGDIEMGSASRRTIEFTYRTADDEERVGAVRMVPMERGPAAVAAVIRDVTERHERRRVVTNLHELTRWLLRAEDPREICAIAVHAGSELLDLPYSGAWLVDGDGGHLDPVAATAGTHEAFGGLPLLSQEAEAVWSVFEGGEPALHEGELVSSAFDDSIESEIVAPIGRHGVLVTGSREASTFTETDVELFSTLAENTRAALDRAERERTIHDRSAELERLTSRLHAVADVLSRDLESELDAVTSALDRDDDGTGPVDSRGTVNAVEDRTGKPSGESSSPARSAASKRQGSDTGSGPPAGKGRADVGTERGMALGANRDPGGDPAASIDAESGRPTHSHGGDDAATDNAGPDRSEEPVQSDAGAEEPTPSDAGAEDHQGSPDSERTDDETGSGGDDGWPGPFHEANPFHTVGPRRDPPAADLPAVPVDSVDVLSTLERAHRLVSDVREFARSAGGVRRRQRVELERAVRSAIHASELDPARLVVEDSATLRANPSRFAHLLETVFDDAAARADGPVTVQVGLLGVEPPVEGSRGFFIRDDAEAFAPDAREPLSDTHDRHPGDIRGLGLSVARVIAEAHDWSVTIEVGETGATVFAVRDVTTLEPE